jgi:hypothetical protein
LAYDGAFTFLLVTIGFEWHSRGRAWLRGPCSFITVVAAFAST